MDTKADNTVTSRGALFWLLLILVAITLCLLLVPRLSPPPSGNVQVLSDEVLPENAQPCNEISASSLGFAFSCPVEGSSYTIELDNVPDGVTPHIVPISSEEQADLQNMPKDGFDCPISVAGNLVFADNQTSNLVTIFKSPVQLKLGYDQVDLDSLDCPVGSDEQAVLIPVFLYTFNEDEANFRVWKPFQNYSDDSRTMTIQFKDWGDPPVGVSPLRAPVDWGPP